MCLLLAPGRPADAAPVRSSAASDVYKGQGIFRHIVDVLMPKANVSADAIRLIEAKMSTHANYRQNYSSFSVEMEVDSAWQGTLPESGRMVLLIIEATGACHAHIPYGRVELPFRQGNLHQILFIALALASMKGWNLMSGKETDIRS